MNCYKCGRNKKECGALFPTKPRGTEEVKEVCKVFDPKMKEIFNGET